MHAETTRRLEHAREAMARVNAYTSTAPLQEALNDDLTRSAVERQLSIVQEALRVALLQDPSLRHSWPQLEAAMARCDQLRDWENPVQAQELAEFVEGELRGWQGMIAVLLKQQQDEGARLDQQIAENLRRLGYES
jgi:uncharacterized protein with HEPN domain